MTTQLPYRVIIIFKLKVNVKRKKKYSLDIWSNSGSVNDRVAVIGRSNPESICGSSKYSINEFLGLSGDTLFCTWIIRLFAC